jgi:hypothetical protein
MPPGLPARRVEGAIADVTQRAACSCSLFLTRVESLAPL